MPIHIKTAEEFEKEIASGKVLLDFFATWCGPCNMLSPVIEELEKEMPDVKFIKVNVDDVPEVAERFGIMSIPTLIYFRNGEVAGQTLGFQPKEAIASIIK